MPGERVFVGKAVNSPPGVAAIARADFLVCINFSYIFSREALAAPRREAVNLHTSYLPWNRGRHPNVWSIIEGTPAGVSLHRMTERVDVGPIYSQKHVPVQWTDNGKSVWLRLQKAAAELFQETWAGLEAGELVPRDQVGAGTFHKAHELYSLNIDLDRTYSARELLNVLRARTFPPHPGALFHDNGRTFSVRIEISEVEGDDVDGA